MSQYGPLVLFGMLVLIWFALERIERRVRNIEARVIEQDRRTHERDSRSQY